MPLDWVEIQKAQKRVSGIAHRTPVVRSRQFDDSAGCNVFFKAENLQRGGSFKFRGAYNKICAEMEHGKITDVVAYSSGNHAQAVALTASLLGLRATIVMPQDAPLAKTEATRRYGAEVITYNRYTENREEIGTRIAGERNALLVPPYDDYLIMAGQATVAVEMIEEVPDLDFLVVPASGNGLLAGCATAAHQMCPPIKVFGVEPEAGNDTFLSFQKGERVTIDVPKTIADGLQASSPGALTFPIVKRLVSGVLLVSDNELVQSLLFVLERMKLLVELSGIAAAAAVRFRKTDFAGKRVGVVLSGGNIDLKRLKEFL